MNNKALYFMPDISGFTAFIGATETEHSKFIISELLELLLDANTIGLKLAEVEGDALFMFTEDLPSFGELMEQIDLMLTRFLQYLGEFKSSRICQCGACVSVQDLEVKFIIHYGDISFIRIKDIIKPFGHDVIKLHRYLKNSIPSHQYLLISSETINHYESSAIDTAQFNELKSDFVLTQDTYDYGDSHYFYKILESDVIASFENDLLPLPDRPADYIKVIDVEQQTESVFAYIADFRTRTEWYTITDRLEFDPYRINRSGTEHICVLPDNSRVKVKTLQVSDDNEQNLHYTESTTDIDGIDSYLMHIKVEPIHENQSRIQFEVFIDVPHDIEKSQTMAGLIPSLDESTTLLLEKLK